MTNNHTDARMTLEMIADFSKSNPIVSLMSDHVADIVALVADLDAQIAAVSEALDMTIDAIDTGIGIDRDFVDEAHYDARKTAKAFEARIRADEREKIAARHDKIANRLQESLDDDPRIGSSNRNTLAILAANYRANAAAIRAMKGEGE